MAADPPRETLRSLFEAGVNAGRIPVEAGEEPPELEGYEVETRLGRGGMGVVYRARNLRLGRLVALKVLRAAADSLEGERLAREGKVLARLSHPHIVGVHDFRMDKEGRPCLVLEYVEGGDLAGRLAGGRPSPAEALAWFADIVDAVGHAHGLGILHRDLKPANILFDRQGRVKVGDFGLASLGRDESTLTLTLSGTTAGTEAYMSPEQRAGRPLDARSDIYSLGVMLYELLSGRRPQGVFAPLPNRKLDRVVRRCLREDAEDRYPDCAALLSDMRRATANRRPWVAASAGAALLGGLTAAVAFRPGSGDPPVEETPPAFRPGREDRAVPAVPASTPVPETDEVDLLAWLAPRMGEVRQLGNWSMRDGILRTTRGGMSPAWIEFPFDPGESYDLEVRMTRLDGQDSLPVFFSTAAGAVSVSIDAWRAGIGGFQLVDGEDLQSSGLAFPARHRSGVADTFQLRVRPGEISMWLNGVFQSRLALAGRRLSLHPIWKTPEGLRFGLGAWESDARFDRVVWRRVEAD